MSKEVEYISFSSLKDWKTCPFYFKLTRIEELKIKEQTIHTEFGGAAHEVLQHALINDINTSGDVLVESFKKIFPEYVENIPIKNRPPEKEIEEFEKQGVVILPQVIPAAKKYFGDFEVVATEEELFEEIENKPLKFKGYIDLVIKTSDGKYHIIDWKTCSWGWDLKKKSDPMVTYQLTFYKMFFAKKHKIEPNNIETHFCLLKRTAKDKNVEFFRVTSGPKKTNNALNMLENCVYNVSKGMFIKNKTSCTRCEFKGTSHCP